MCAVLLTAMLKVDQRDLMGRQDTRVKLVGLACTERRETWVHLEILVIPVQLVTKE